MKIPYAEPYKVKMVESIRRSSMMNAGNGLEMPNIIYSICKVKKYLLIY